MVGNAVTKFLMHFLASRELSRNEDSVSTVIESNYLGKSSMALLLMNRQLGFLVSSCHTENERTATCRKQRGIADGQNSKLQLEISVGDVLKKEYEPCVQNDRPRRCDRDSPRWEKNLTVKDWSAPISLMLLFAFIVDFWCLYKSSYGTKLFISWYNFYESRTDELTKNN